MTADLSPTPRDERPIRYGSTMLRRFGWFYKLLGLGAVMQRTRFEDHSAERIREAADKGPVVYVLLQRAVLDQLALNAVLNRRRLPLATWTNGGASFYWQPVAEAWKDVFARIGSLFSFGRTPDPIASGWLSRVVADGQTTMVFLQGGKPLTGPEQDPLAALIAAQEACDKPIQLVPVICVWDRAPEQYESAVRDFLLGSREFPSLLTKLQSLYVPSASRPFLQVGEPLDLAAFVSRASPARRLDSLRTILRRYLKREGKVVRGPRLLPRPVLKSLVLDAPKMRAFATEHAKETGKPVAAVRKTMEKEFNAIAANFSWPLIRFLSIAMKPLWTRVFNGYDIRDEDLDKIRNAMREGSAVLVPCHKSHFDYLLLSWVFFYDDLIVPHVVAGINLAIWPVHYVLRAGGGFFIKRKFAGEAIHATVFARYLRELLLHGYPVEFFIEGGRTRTGKLLMPRVGVLDMVLEAAEAAPKKHEITLLPMAIAYEQVAEEGAYQSELEGGKKQAESMGQLIKARRVLRQRFGRVYLRVGEPVKCSDITADGWKELDPETRNAKLFHTGKALVHRIGAAMVVLPTGLVALGLLAHHRQGIGHAELHARLERLRSLLEHLGALESSAMNHFDSAMAQALDRFLREGHIERIGEGDQRVWRIVPERRSLLDFHKNQLLHYLAVPCMVSAAIRANGPETFTVAELEDDLEWLAGLLRREFTLDPDLDTQGLLAYGLEALTHHGAVAPTEAGYAVSDPEAIGEILGLLRALLESYRLVAASAKSLPSRALSQKAFVDSILERKDDWLQEGVATRPESFGAVALKNAVAVLAEDGIIDRSTEVLGADAAAAADLEARLAKALGA